MPGRRARRTVGLGPRGSGVFRGGTIHDVAQVVGAGFSVSEESGEIATLVKLIRVITLAPVVLVISLAARARGLPSGSAARPPPLPGFVVGFPVLAAANSIGAVPAVVVEALSTLSGWALLTAIAAVGMKTSLRSILDVGGQAIVLIVGETLFIGLFILAGIRLIGT